MCGLVFVANNKGTLFSTSVLNKAFRQLLILDTLRGAHSTGYFGVGKTLPKAHWVKSAVDGYQFVNLKEVKEDLDKGWRYNVLVGHNRYATAGSINNDNAHPFNHGKITGVHNGGVHDRKLLEDKDEKIAVDSDQLFYHLEQKGFDDLHKNLNANYALIWHDESDDTVHFIRDWTSSERPFWFVRFKNGNWMGASERAMLQVVIERQAALKNAEHEFFELPRGEEWVFDVSEGQFELKEVIPRKMPSFPAPVRYTSSSNVTYLPKQKSKKKRKQKYDQELRYNSIMSAYDASLSVGDTLEFEFKDFKPYKKHPDRGCVEGQYINPGFPNTKIKVFAHNIETELAETWAESEFPWEAKIESAYEYAKQRQLCVMVGDATPTDPLYLEDEIEQLDLDWLRQELNPDCPIDGYQDYDEDIPFDTVKRTIDGTAYDEDKWKAAQQNGCACCSRPMPDFHSENMESCETVLVGWVLCPTCSNNNQQ